MTSSPPAARRLSTQASREAALEAARALLVEGGPAAVTLKAVAARMGRTHATLIHHFGSAQDLQRALIAGMAQAITARIAAAARAVRAGAAAPATLVDLVFDAWADGGAGALASWMIVHGDTRALDPVLGAVRDLVEELGPREGLADKALQLSLMALGDSLLGAPMAQALDVPRDRARALALAALMSPS